MGVEVLIPLFGILIVLVPVFGLTTVLTLRFGGKPFVETLARELRGDGQGGGTEFHIELRELTEQVDALTAEVHRLRSAQVFDQKLLEGRSAETTTSA
jgi:hypothetical protein